MTYARVDALVRYGLGKKLLEPSDERYIRNRLLERMGMERYEAESGLESETLEEILSGLTDDAVSRKITPDSGACRDLFQTALMGELTPRPSEVIARFWQEYQSSPEAATNWFYGFCQDCDYIRRYRIQKDLRWLTGTPYGDLVITVNLSKPEKDPRDIAAAKLRPQGGYPACQLCVENEGYAGRVDHPARQNHRIIPIKVAGEDWGFQYSPYVYYNEHCIVLNQKHVPMTIDRRAFEKLFSFLDQFPHYIVGSNADLPIVGGSILTHEHFQGGRFDFPMVKAPVERSFHSRKYPDVSAGIVKWPMSVLRLRGKDSRRLADLADHILTLWRGYTDEARGIFAFSEGAPHNTITPIARMRGGEYEIDLVLRNNRTTEEHPMGVFHPHAELHHIKKENIGLIEVMGLAVLPARLKREMEQVKKTLLEGGDLRADPDTAKHAQWAEGWAPKYGKDQSSLDEAVQAEIGAVFCKVLEHCGVYHRDADGQSGFEAFIKQCGFEA